jgi:3-hydroxyisobutyrate dehydrogenase
MNGNVTLLGLGTMGSGMAINLLKAGFKLTAYNRTEAKAQPLVAAGARYAATPAEAARNASIVIGLLADDAVSREVWTSKDGALSSIGKDTIVIESSTVSPAWIAELAALVASHGAEFLDAPVTGSRTQAADGQLTFLVGGSANALEAATPVLKAMSKDIVHLGPSGSGARMKLINNFLCGVQAASLAEGLVWIERSGLDPQKALSLLNAGAPGSPLLKALGERMLHRNYSVNFLLKLLAKDMNYAQAEAATCQLSLQTAEGAQRLFENAIAAGHGEQDMASVVELLRNR